MGEEEPPAATPLTPSRAMPNTPKKSWTERRAFYALAFWAAVLGAPENRAAAQSDDQPRLSFSGAQRSRYEAVESQFRPGFDESDRVLAMQTSLRFDALLPRLNVVGEIMDSRAELNDRGSYLNALEVNTLEPVQAYVALRSKGDGDGRSSTVRLGLMTLDLGKRRLLARNRYRNTVTSFAGIDWDWHDSDDRELRAFYLQPRHPLPTDKEALLQNEQQLDRGLRDSALLGLFYQLRPWARGSTLETYLLSFRFSPVASAAALDLDSLGMRAYRAAKPHELSYEVEAVLQGGTSGGMVAGIARDDLRVHAHFLHLELGYTFNGAWAPTLAAQYDVATGDRDPLDARDERFNTLFGARRFDFGPTGIYGPFFRSNIETPGVRLTLHPRPRLQGMVAYRAYYLESPRDQWIGTGLADPTGRSGDSLGRQLEASFTWAAIENRLSFETGVAKFDVGAFPRITQGADFRGDPTYFYAALTTRFRP
jgi:Alginate export